MFISALCIVKNEAENLHRWLDNMQQVADELIIVDTGSTDNTIDIARQGGAAVYNFSWQNNFAVARNFALEQVSGDWVVFLDADEYYPVQALKKIRLIIADIDKRPNVAGLMAPRIDIDVDNGQNQYIDVSNQCRIFRRNCRYVGPIHETLQLPLTMILVQDDRLLFYHTGYSAGYIKEKLKRNLVMLSDNMSQPGYNCRPMDYRYLMDCYYGLEEYDKAIAMSNKCLTMTAELASEISYIHKIRIKSAYCQGVDFAIVWQYLQEAIKQGNKDYFLQLTGHYLWEYGRRREAVDYIKAGLAMTQDNTPKNPVYELLPISYMIVGEDLIAQDEMKAGLIMLRQAVQKFPYVSILQKSLKRAEDYCQRKGFS